MIIKFSEEDHDDQVDDDHITSLAAHTLFADDNHDAQGVMVIHSSFCCSSDKGYKGEKRNLPVFYSIITPNPQNPHIHKNVQSTN